MVETELRELLRERADGVQPSGQLPPPVRRRATRRRWTNGSLVTLSAVAVIAGSIVGIQAALSRRAAPLPATTPTPLPTPIGVFAGVWPETDAAALEQEQAAVDEGRDSWRLDPVQTAVAFARPYFGDVDIGSRMLSDSGDVALVDCWDPRYGDGAATRTTVTLRRLGRQGADGIWSVTGSEFGGVVLTAPRPDALVVPGVGLEVAGHALAGVPVDVVHPRLLVPGDSAVDDRMDLDAGEFQGVLRFVPDGGDSGYILFVPAFDSSRVEPGPRYAVVGFTVLRLAEETAPPSAPPAADIHFAIWPEVDPQAVADEQAAVDQGQDPWRKDPIEVARNFASAIMGWSPDVLSVAAEQGGSTDTHDIVDLWNVVIAKEAGLTVRPVVVQGQTVGSAVAGLHASQYATTVTLDQLGRTGDGGIWSVTRVETGLLDVSSPPDHQDTLVAMEPLEVSGSVTQPPAGWTLRSTMEYAGSLFQLSEAQTSNELTLNGPSFAVTLQPTAVYADGPTLALRLFSGDGTLLGMWARRFVQAMPTLAPSPSKTAPSDEGVYGAMQNAIRASSPDGWRIQLDGTTLDGDWQLDGIVDDGTGPGRLMVDFTDRPNMLEAHPCDDPEFAQGAPCVERRLADGDLLVLRDVLDQNGNKTIEAVLIHPDRSGVGAEAGNWVISGTPGASPGGSLEQVTRPDPLYTVEELGQLVVAVDKETSLCIRTGC